MRPSLTSIISLALLVAVHATFDTPAGTRPGLKMVDQLTAAVSGIQARTNHEELSSDLMGMVDSILTPRDPSPSLNEDPPEVSWSEVLTYEAALEAFVDGSHPILHSRDAFAPESVTSSIGEVDYDKSLQTDIPGTFPTADTLSLVIKLQDSLQRERRRRKRAEVQLYLSQKRERRTKRRLRTAQQQLSAICRDFGN